MVLKEMAFNALEAISLITSSLLETTTAEHPLGHSLWFSTRLGSSATFSYYLRR